MVPRFSILGRELARRVGLLVGKIVAVCDDTAGRTGVSDIVAQISNLPYRRLPVGWRLEQCMGCGLEIRDTAGWKPALLCYQLRTSPSSKTCRLARIRLRIASDVRLVFATGTPWVCESVKYAG